jgi:hypothetical protein
MVYKINFLVFLDYILLNLFFLVKKKNYGVICWVRLVVLGSCFAFPALFLVVLLSAFFCSVSSAVSSSGLVAGGLGIVSKSAACSSALKQSRSLPGRQAVLWCHAPGQSPLFMGPPRMCFLPRQS